MARAARRSDKIAWDDEWILSNYEPTVSLRDLRRLYNSVHRTDIGEETFKTHCYKKLDCGDKDFRITPEEGEWIIEHYNEYGVETYRKLNEIFGRSRKKCTVMQWAQRHGASALRKHEWDDEWIIERWDSVRNWLTLRNEYNKAHGTNIGYNTFKRHCNGFLFLDYHYTNEQEEWLIENYPKYGRKKTAELFEKKFGEKRSPQAIKTRCGRFLGLTVTEERMREVYTENGLANAYEIGRVSKQDRDMWIKTEDGWVKLKKVVYGDVPDGYVIVHLDGDRTNCEKENLYAIPRSITGKMSGYKFWSENRDITKTGILVCQLEDALNRKMGEK